MSQAFTQGFIIKNGQRVIDSSVGALTVQGNVNIGANALTTTDLLLKQATASRFDIKNAADNDIRDLQLRTVTALNFYSYDDNSVIAAGDGDNLQLLLRARNSGVGLVEVARLQGAAAPALCVGNSGATANDDFASVADQVKLGSYEAGAGQRTLALATELAVVAAAAGASDAYLNIRVNGATYKLMLHT